MGVGARQLIFLMTANVLSLSPHWNLVKVWGLGLGLRFGVWGSHFENNYLTEMCSGSEAGSYLRLIDFLYHSTLGLRVIKKTKKVQCSRFGLQRWA